VLQVEATTDGGCSGITFRAQPTTGTLSLLSRSSVVKFAANNPTRSREQLRKLVVRPLIRVELVLDPHPHRLHPHLLLLKVPMVPRLPLEPASRMRTNAAAAQWVHQVLQESLELMASQETMESQALMDNPAKMLHRQNMLLHVSANAHLDRQDQPEVPETKDQKVIPESKENRAPQENLVRKAHLASKVPPAHQDCLVVPETKESPESMSQELRHPALLAVKEKWDHLDHPAHLERRASPVLPDPKDLRVIRVILDHTESPERQDPLDHLEPLVLLAVATIALRQERHQAIRNDVLTDSEGNNLWTFILFVFLYYGQCHKV
jgi:hypothetical protein